MKRCRLAVAVAVATLCLRALAAPAPIHLGPGEPKAYAWQPDESWPGHTLADARLDKQVRLWRAGLSLPEVFAGIEEQTGVAICTWPPHDPIKRLRVNLYLNDEHPPTLREVMAQLSWVMRANFACTDGPERRYYLLGTGEVKDVEARLAAAQHQREVAARKQLLPQLERYGAALDLSREEAIARYRGKDDALLLTLLEPDQRAKLRVLCSLSQEQLATLAEQGELTLTLTDRELAQRAGLPDGDDEAEWLASVHMYGGGSGRGMHGGTADEGEIQADFALTREGPRQRGGGLRRAGSMGGGPVREASGLPPYFPVVSDGGGPPEAELEVRCLLGEVFTEESEREFRNQAYDRWEKESRERRERELREAMRASQQLSAGTRRRLEQVTITWQVNTWMGPPWRVQEAVAEATGLSVISDYLEWGDRQFANPVVLIPQAPERIQAWREETRRFARAHPEEWHQILDAGEFVKRFPGPKFEVPVLDWLTVLCYPGVQTGHGGGGLPQDVEGWEWGDAGPLLRFRSPFPEVWRGAMLPEPVERMIEEAIQPYLKMAEEGTLPKEVPFPLDLRTQGWIVSQLDSVQLRVAPSLARDDPSTLAGQLHNGLVTQVLGHISGAERALRFLGTLGEDQWEALRTTGLNAAELAPAQQQALATLSGRVGVRSDTGEVVIEGTLMLFLVSQGSDKLQVRGPEDSEAEEFDLSPPLQTEVALPPPLVLSRRE